MHAKDQAVEHKQASVGEGPQMWALLMKEVTQTSKKHSNSLALKKNIAILPKVHRYKLSFNSLFLFQVA